MNFKEQKCYALLSLLIVSMITCTISFADETAAQQINANKETMKKPNLKAAQSSSNNENKVSSKSNDAEPQAADSTNKKTSAAEESKKVDSEAKTTADPKLAQQTNATTSTQQAAKGIDKAANSNENQTTDPQTTNNADSASTQQTGASANPETDKNANADESLKTDPEANKDADQKTTQQADAETSQATADDSDIPPPPPIQKDPLEKFNRGVFAFNDKIDTYLLKPVATFYNKIMPKPLNQGVHNFFNNIGTLPTIANDILQLNFYQTANDVWRFGINSTVGIAGFFDIATRMNLKYYSNDFGLTLAAWGYKNSTYLVLPFFGPSTIRDGIGIPVDYFAFSIYPYVNPTSARYELYGLGVVDRRAQLLKMESVMEEAALDKYIFVRNAYTQRRNYQIDQGQHLGYEDQLAEAKIEAKEKAIPEPNTDLRPPQ